MDIRFCITILIVFVFCLSSCTKNESIEIDLPVCSVKVGGVGSYVNSNISGLKSNLNGLKAISVNKDTDVPDNIKGYSIKVTNQDYSSVPEINNEYEFVVNGGSCVVEGVTIGRNRFIAESIPDDGVFGNNFTGWNEWGPIVNIESGSDWESRLPQYAENAANDYPVYTKCADTTNLLVKQSPANNSIVFDMKPVNGRLLIVIENRYSHPNKKHRLDVTINGVKKSIDMGKAIWYVFNDDTDSGGSIPVRVEYWHKNKNQINYKKYADSTDDYSYEIGKNITHLLHFE